MKRLITILLITAMSLGAFAQSMGIRFNDRQGREFVVYAPSGEFAYSMFEGDHISRDYEGRVTCVGNTYISYNYYGQVTCIGDIYISRPRQPGWRLIPHLRLQRQHLPNQRKSKE